MNLLPKESITKFQNAKLIEIIVKRDLKKTLTCLVPTSLLGVNFVTHKDFSRTREVNMTRKQTYIVSTNVGLQFVV